MNTIKTLALISALSLPTAAFADVNFMILGRNAYGEQTDATTVVYPSSSLDYPFEAGIEIGESGDSAFSSGKLTIPGGNEATLEYEDGAWETGAEFATLAALNDAMTSGLYILDMVKTGGEEFTMPFDVLSDYLVFPSSPQISNYAALQNADPSAAITISWDAWTEGTTSDYIMVYIETANGNETVYESPSPMEGGALLGTATSFEIPANTLITGMDYQVCVEFIDLFVFESGTVPDYTTAMKGMYASNTTDARLHTSGTAPLSAFLSFQLWNNVSWTLNSVNGTFSGKSGLDASSVGESVQFVISAESDVGIANVLFTGPTGSGISSAAANGVDNYDGQFSYRKDNVTPYIANGTYSVNYDGTVYTGPIDYAPTAASHTLLSASITVDDTIIQSISWTAYSAADLTSPIDISGGERGVSVQLEDKNYNRIKEFYDLPATQNSVDLSADNISIYDLGRIYLVYAGEANDNLIYSNHFSSYDIDVSEWANIFEPIPHNNGWVIPEGINDISSFGAFMDELYPYIYNASLDEFINGEYLADGDGWMYIFEGASLQGGFYAYRYATDSWCWTNYNWYGWIYDYGSSSWIDFTPVIPR